MDSILTSIKDQLGIMEEQEDFNSQLIMHINTVFSVLTQMGVGPAEGFFIEDDEATWDDYIDDVPVLRMVRTYIYLKVKLIFDSPASGTLMEAIKQNIAELEWRLNSAVDPKNQNGGED